MANPEQVDRYAGYSKLKFDRPHAKVLRVTMDNGKFNTAEHAMHAELARIWLDIDADPDINAAIITGAGSVFSAGGDFAMIKEIMGDFAYRARAWRERATSSTTSSTAQSRSSARCAAWPSAPVWCAGSWPTSRSPAKTAASSTATPASASQRATTSSGLSVA